MSTTHSSAPVLVAGGGIGGLAAALALARQGFDVKVLEQSPAIGEIGAGIQLGPNAFSAFDALGIGELARSRAVYTDELVMHDALDETLVGRIPVGAAFRTRFGNPYAVIHRAEVHLSLFEGAQATGRIEFLTSTKVARIEQDDDGVTVHDANGGTHRGIALIGADGVKSAVRQQYLGDAPRGSAGPRPIATRSTTGRSAARRCWAMQRIRCCNTSRKGPAWRWRTASHSARRCA